MDVARHWLRGGGGFSPPKLNFSPSPNKQSLPILIFLYESTQKCIISHKIPQKFSGDGAQPPTPWVPAAPQLRAFSAALTPLALSSGPR